MNKFSKLALTAGVVGAVGAAGSFGTYAAFTSGPTSTSVNVKNAVMGVETSQLTISGADQIRTADGSNAHVGEIILKNNSNVPAHPYVDFDGLVGTISSARGYESSENQLAESLQVDTFVDEAMFSRPFGGAAQEGQPPEVSQKPGFLDQGTRLWKVNRRGWAPVFDVDNGTTVGLNTPRVVIPAGETRKLFIRLKLRETPSTINGQPGSDANDNLMQGHSTVMKVNVAMVEKDGVPDDSVLSPANDAGN
jgi:hypothetical protein